jgi:peptidoglycan/LPS O-acetylase OafA/YrhL
MRRIPTLDGWRAIAIAAVTAHHLTRGFYAQEAAYDSDNTQYGAFGVDIFFGLSGLLITKLLLEEWRERGSFDLTGFYLRRAFRILPPYLGYLFVCTLAGLWRSPWEAAGCLLFFRNYVPDHLMGPSTQHLWSLAVEEHFYLLWPGLLFLLQPRRARTAAPALALCFALWRMVESQLATPTLPLVPAHFRTDLRLDALLWGCVFAFLLDDAGQREKLGAQLRWPVWLAAAGGWLMCVRYYSPLTSVWIACGVPILLMGTVTHPAWKLSRALEWAPVAWLGRISYSLYLWQQLFFVAGWDFAKMGHSAHAWQQWPLNLVACLATATASYYLIEKPLIRIGRRLAERASQPSAKPTYKLASLPAEGVAE